MDTMSYATNERRVAGGTHGRQQAPRWFNIRLLLASASCIVVAALLASSVDRPRLRPIAVLVLLIVAAAWWVAVKGLMHTSKSSRRSAGAPAQPPGKKPTPEPDSNPGPDPTTGTTPSPGPKPPLNGAGPIAGPHGSGMVQPHPNPWPPRGTAGAGQPGPYPNTYQTSHPGQSRQHGRIPHQPPQPQLDSKSNRNAYPRLGPGNLRPLVFVRPSAFGAADWRLPPLVAQSGIAADQACFGDLALRAASVIGRGHRHVEKRNKALPRQDAYQLGTAQYGDRGYLLAAVADGTSSAAHADLGASIAAVGAVEFLSQLLRTGAVPDEQSHAQLFRSLADTIADFAAQDQNYPDAYTTTLLTAVVPDAPTNPDGSREVWLSWIGDSPAWLLDQHGWRQVSGHSKDGLDRNTLVGSLPGRPQKFQHSMIELPAGCVLALMSDGLGDALTDFSSGQAELARRWLAPPSLLEFLRDLDFDGPGQDDDRTAVIVWCDPGRQTAS